MPECFLFPENVCAYDTDLLLPKLCICHDCSSVNKPCLNNKIAP